MIINGKEITTGVRQKVRDWLCEELLSSLTKEPTNIDFISLDFYSDGGTGTM